MKTRIGDLKQARIQAIKAQAWVARVAEGEKLAGQIDMFVKLMDEALEKEA